MPQKAPKGTPTLSIKFYPSTRVSEKKKESPITAYIHTNRWFDEQRAYKPLQIATGIYVNPQYWNKTTNRATGAFSFINTRLSIFEQTVKEAWQQALIMGVHEDYELLKENILGEFNQAIQDIGTTVPPTSFNKKETPTKEVFPIKKKNNAYSFSTEKIDPEKITWLEYVQMAKSKIERETGKEENATYKSYILQLQQFHKENEIPQVLLNAISTEYFEAFSLYLKENRKWSFGYWSRYNINTKMFYNYAKDKDRLILPTVNFNVTLLKKKPKPDKKTVSLNIDQLKAIIALEFNLPKEKTLKLSRDYLVVGCLTGGLRASDLLRLGKIQEQTVGKKKVRYVESFSKKTHTYVKLPLFKPADDILRSYDDKLPYIAEKTLNENVKVVAERAGLDKIEIALSKILLKNNKQETSSKKMHELVTIKTARKSFCTLMLQYYKMDVATIMAFSGHESISSFETYIADSGYNSMFESFATLAIEDKTFG